MLPVQRKKVDISVSRSQLRRQHARSFLPSDTSLEFDTAGKAAVPEVWQITHAQEYPQQNAKGLSLATAYTVRNRPLRGRPVTRIVNTLTRVTMLCPRRESRLRAPLVLLSRTPKSMHPYSLSRDAPHCPHHASAFLMHHRLQTRIRGVCPYHQPTPQAVYEKARCLTPIVIRT